MIVDCDGTERGWREKVADAFFYGVRGREGVVDVSDGEGEARTEEGGAR